MSNFEDDWALVHPRRRRTLWDACRDSGIVTIAGPDSARRWFLTELHNDLRNEDVDHKVIVCLAEGDATVYIPSRNPVEPLRLAFRRSDHLADDVAEALPPNLADSFEPWLLEPLPTPSWPEQETPLDRLTATFQFAYDHGLFRRIVIAYDYFHRVCCDSTPLADELRSTVLRLSSVPWATVVLGLADIQTLFEIPDPDLRDLMSATTYKIGRDQVDPTNIERIAWTASWKRKDASV